MGLRDKKLAYLASPYTHLSPEVMHERYKAAERALVHYTNKGEHVFSPIVHSHPAAVSYDMPKDYHFWLEFNLNFLGRCDELWVLTLPGWQESKGVQAEIKYAQEIGRTMLLVPPVYE